MANWSNPTLSSTYTNFLDELKTRDTDLALLFDGTGTNVPTGTIRWNSSSGLFQKWSGSAWSNQIIALGSGGTGSGTAAGARTALGLEINTNVQAYNTKLQNLSSTTFAANQIAYFTGPTGLAATALTSTARSLLDDNSTAEMRATLGLAIGSNVQAYSASLNSISGLSTVADRMLYTTGSNTYSVTPLTSFARTLLDDTTASAARTTLGLGTLATLNTVTINNGNWSGTALSISNGGTGQTDRIGALEAFGVYAGIVNSSGSAISLPTGWGSGLSSNIYTITHNLGSASYAVDLTVESNIGIGSNGDRMAVLYTRNANTFQVVIWDGGGGVRNHTFHFILYDY